MQVLKSKGFSLPKEVEGFVKDSDIKREDILTITATALSIIIFYYVEE
jgi:hypothetical protein